MDEVAVWSTFEASTGREAEVEAFLRDCAARLRSEPGTTSFLALTLGSGRYATFATMRDEAALAAHVAGPVADDVRARASDLFVAAPAIVKGAVLAAAIDRAAEDASSRTGLVPDSGSPPAPGSPARRR